MGLQAALENVGDVQIVQRFLPGLPAHGPLQHPVVPDAENLDPRPFDRLVQALLQIAGGLVPFVEDLQPGVALIDPQFIDPAGKRRPIPLEAPQFLEAGHGDIGDYGRAIGELHQNDALFLCGFAEADRQGEPE